MGTKTPVVIPYSQLEYTATFTEPMLELVGKMQDVVVPFVQALAPFGFVFEETDFQLTGTKPKDHVITFVRPNSGPLPEARVAIRWGMLTVRQDQPDWKNAESIASLCSTALATILGLGKATVREQRVLLMMHVQSQTTPVAELTEALLTPRARELQDGEIVGQGIIVHRQNGSMVIDKSSAFANGMFVRIERSFGPDVSIEKMGEALLDDELRLWEMLSLEGEL